MRGRADSPDERLVEEFLSTGDERCFGILFARHRRQVYAACFAVVRNEAAAEDLCQDTFMTALRKLEQFRGESFAGWLFTIARRLCLNHLRAGLREVAADPPDVAAPGGPPGEDAERVEAALLRLSAPQRICFKLFFVEGYSYREVARITGYTEREVKTHLQSGRRRFVAAWTALAAEIA